MIREWFGIFIKLQSNKKLFDFIQFRCFYKNDYFI